MHVACRYFSWYATNQHLSNNNWVIVGKNSIYFTGIVKVYIEIFILFQNTSIYSKDCRQSLWESHLLAIGGVILTIYIRCTVASLPASTTDQYGSRNEPVTSERTGTPRKRPIAVHLTPIHVELLILDSLCAQKRALLLKQPLITND